MKTDIFVLLLVSIVYEAKANPEVIELIETGIGCDNHFLENQKDLITWKDPNTSTEAKSACMLSYTEMNMRNFKEFNELPRINAYAYCLVTPKALKSISVLRNEKQSNIEVDENTIVLCDCNSRNQSIPDKDLFNVKFRLAKARKETYEYYYVISDSMSKINSVWGIKIKNNVN